MTDNYESVRHWGMFLDVAEPAQVQTEDRSQKTCKLSENGATNRQGNFIQGYEVAFGLHLLEEVN